ncbi:hypothetical protein XELAEV_18006676mg [Xenopus laevis]|uniref:Uncharacterized protein n=1 Tax=Xenopus laevis TaxID=8355 RepID=A0A974DZQ1_XENLA|nr:hypothetical protein XELAEV_18006676mg [Xenopus laevis]
MTWNAKCIFPQLLKGMITVTFSMLSIPNLFLFVLSFFVLISIAILPAIENSIWLSMSVQFSSLTNLSF